MTKEQAEALAASIQQQFPKACVYALDSADTRNAPYHWFIGIKRVAGDVDPAILIYSEREWRDILNAHAILRDVE